jgi:hypothetical protein
VRRIVHCGIALGLLTALVSAATPAISPDAVLDHIKFLASDALKGRGDGTPELDRAADYIAQQFRSAGLRPGVHGRDWFQPFELIAGLTIGANNDLVIDAHGQHPVRLVLGTSYYPLSATPNDVPSVASALLDDVPLVFAGYGIAAPAMNYDDYAGVDVSGKAVLIFSHEPQESRRDSRLNGDKPLRETTLYAKAAAARTRGARALLVVSDPSHTVDPVNYGLFAIDPDPEDHAIPVLRIRRADMAPLLQAWGLDRVAAEIDGDLMPRSRVLGGALVHYAEYFTRNRRQVRNVVGVLPGSDPVKAKQAIVIGAHYDHVGMGGRFSAAPERTGEIHNGADDNASGTASIIEMARAAAADRSRFPRSLVFVAFAGEERGLLGSAEYASEPAIPMSDTVVMLNLDMVGRANGKVDVSGLESSQPMLLKDIQDAARAAGGIEILQQGPGAGRSDDSSFLDKRVPAINFFTGFHSDYHRPTDDWNKIDAAGTARVATLALEFAARVAAHDDRPQFEP